MIKRLGLILFLLLNYTEWTQAQTYPLDSVLTIYENQYGVKFSYDAELINLIEGRFELKSDLKSFFKSIEEVLPITVKNISEDYYSLAVKEASYALTILDSMNGDSIDPALVVVVVNSKSITTDQSDKQVLFNYKPKISDTLLVYTMGYEVKHIPIYDLLNQQDISLDLTYTAIELSSVIVQDYLTEGINLNPSSQSIDIAVEDLPLLPGETDGDIFTSIAALPGVTSPDQRAGNLFVRGSFTDQTLILFDDIPIYHKGHYYGTISPYNPKIISNVSVFRNGFHTRLGDRVGGAIVINSEKNLTTADFDGGLGVNTLYGMGYVKTALIKNKLGLSVGARRSYPTTFKSPKLEAISESVFDATGAITPEGELVDDLDILFEDYHAKLSYQLNTKNLLTLSTIYTNTNAGYSKDPTDDLGGAEEKFKTHNIGFNLKWNTDLSDRLSSKFSSTYSEYVYDYSNKSITTEIRNNLSYNKLKDINFREELSYKSKFYEADLGVDYKWQEVTINYTNMLIVDNEMYEFNKIVSSHSISPYFNLDLNRWEKLFVRVGLRGNYYTQLETVQLDPRLFINYQLFDWLTLKGAIGQYHQYLSQVRNLEYSGGGFDNELWTLADGEMGNIINGIQSSAGAVFHGKGWVFESEAYYKELNGMSMGNARELSSTTAVFTADQWIKGVDFMLKRELIPEMDLWVSYTYSQSEIVLDTSNVSYVAKYVQPHVFYIGSAFDKNNWSISASWKLSSGLFAKSLNVYQVENVFLKKLANNPNLINPTGQIREGRYDNIQSLDISVAYRVPQNEKHDWSASFGLSLINVLNQENQIDEVHKGLPPTWAERYAIGFAPNLMVLFEW